MILIVITIGMIILLILCLDNILHRNNNYQKILIRSHVDKKFFERRNSKELKENYKLFLKKCNNNQKP